jgi:hypothetical protein
MNRYPLWKYLIIAVALIVSTLYTLPNFYGESPAVQVSTSRSAIAIDTALMDRVEKSLAAAKLPADGIYLDGNSLKVRFHDPDTQIKAIGRQLGGGQGFFHPIHQRGINGNGRAGGRHLHRRAFTVEIGQGIQGGNDQRHGDDQVFPERITVHEARQGSGRRAGAAAVR